MRIRKDRKPIIIGIAAVVVIGTIVIVNNNKKDEINYENMTNEEISVAVQNKVEKMEVNNLAGMSERDRMEYYVSTFIKDVESGKYEEAYEMLDTIMNKYLTSHKPKDSNSTMEMWKLREQAKQLAEEVIYGEIVYQYH